MSTTYSIQDTTLTSLGNAVRKVWNTEDTFTPAQMASRIDELGTGTIIDINNISSNHINPLTNRWQRPNNWPDIDALADEIVGDQDCVYFTYDLSLHEDFHHLGLYVNMSQGDKWYLDRYDEGNFVHTHFEMDKDTYLRYDLTEEPDNSQVQVWRLTSNGHIKQCSFAPWTTNSGSTNVPPAYQPCVDRSGTLPWVNFFENPTSSNMVPHNTRINITKWLEHDALIIGKNAILTTLDSYWYGATNLISIDVSKWQTENWNITSLTNCWYDCWCLKELKLNYWNTENWTVTNLSGCWAFCYSLDTLEIDKWNTENWCVTTLYQTWYNCYSLKRLNLNSWDTEDWAITSFSSTWSGCRALKELKIDQWNVKNWRPNSLTSIWYNCQSLKKLDLNNWDTKNWQITSLSSAWSGCHNLISLKISSWDTSNWIVNSLANTWSGCRKLEKCEIENWDVSKWNPTSLNTSWQECNSLKTLDLSKWDTSQWDALTTISNAWSYCYSLQELKISSLLQNNCAITNITSAWAYCMSLKRLDLNNWNTTNWNISSLSSIWSTCLNLVELNVNEWDTSNWTVTNMSSFMADCYSLENLNLGNWDASNWTITSISFSGVRKLRNISFPKNLNWSLMTASINFSTIEPLRTISNISQCVTHSYYSCHRLTSTSLKNILNNLPTISSTKTITLGPINTSKLTAEDIAVATNKGWTVA